MCKIRFTKNKKFCSPVKILYTWDKITIKTILRFEPKGSPLVFLSKGKMYSNSKSNVLPRFKEVGSTTFPLVDDVIVDLAHFLYSSVNKPGVKTIRQLFNVSNFTTL